MHIAHGYVEIYLFLTSILERDISVHAMATLVPENEPWNALKRRLGGTVTEVA